MTLHVHDCDNCVNIASGMLRILHPNPENNHFQSEAVELGLCLKTVSPNLNSMNISRQCQMYLYSTINGQTNSHNIHKHLPE